ncbi:MAG: ABC transporter permease [Candidatus Heimdallarchaeota archaeon]
MAVQNVGFEIKTGFRVLGIGIKRDLINIRRYKFRLIGWLLNMSIGMFSGYLFSVLFELNPVTAGETGISTATQVFIFFIGGVALTTFSDSAIWAPMMRIEQDIHYGTLEAVFVTPSNRIAYLLSPSISDALINLIFFIPAYIIIMAINGTLTNLYVIGTTLLVVFVTIVSMLAFGLFFAMIALLIRKAQPIAVFLSMMMQFLCGAYVPVQAYASMNPVFGPILKYIALCFPSTYCYDLFRYFTFGSQYNPLFPVWVEFVILGVISIAFVIIAGFLLKLVERKAKNVGLSIL